MRKQKEVGIISRIKKKLDNICQQKCIGRMKVLFDDNPYKYQMIQKEFTIESLSVRKHM